MGETARVKLSGGPDKTVTWIWLDAAEARLRVEFYDFGELAHRMFGNDIAYTITVHDMDRLLTLAGKNEASIIQWLSAGFRSYFEIKRWLEENGIAFEVETESWA